MGTVREASVVGVEWRGSGERRDRRSEGRGGQGPGRDSGHWWVCRGETLSGSSWGTGGPQVQKGRSGARSEAAVGIRLVVAAAGVPSGQILDTF